MYFVIYMYMAGIQISLCCKTDNLVLQQAWRWRMTVNLFSDYTHFYASIVNKTALKNWLLVRNVFNSTERNSLYTAYMYYIAMYADLGSWLETTLWRQSKDLVISDQMFMFHIEDCIWRQCKGRNRNDDEWSFSKRKIYNWQ